jgi:hypothetical protein
MIARAGKQDAPTQWQRPAEYLRCAGNTSKSLWHRTVARRLALGSIPRTFTFRTTFPTFHTPTDLLSVALRPLLTTLPARLSSALSVMLIRAALKAT